jgi:excinuclease Cho
MRRRPASTFASQAEVDFSYPDHLRSWAEALPAVPGVYTFHGESQEALPLYIGKSVNLRARVLAHLRNADEARMLRQARSISFERTGGEIGALLREAQLIKLRQPLYNQKLRRSRQLCALRLDAAGVPGVVYARDLDFATTPELFGLYGSRGAALDALRALADLHRLCYGQLGLERLPPGRGCFRASIRQCAGACRGDETPQAHRERLQAALEDLRVVCWDWPGAVGLRETDGEGCTRVHVVRHWCYLGSVDDAAQARGLDQPAAGFDADGYRVLCRPLLTGRADLIPL